MMRGLAKAYSNVARCAFEDGPDEVQQSRDAPPRVRRYAKGDRKPNEQHRAQGVKRARNTPVLWPIEGRNRSMRRASTGGCAELSDRGGPA